MDDFKPQPLPTMLFEYALGGDDGVAGIACISGDAAGFRSLERPMDRDSIRSTIASCLKQEEFARSEDVQRLEAQCESDEAIDKITETHRQWFTEWRASADGS